MYRFVVSPCTATVQEVELTSLNDTAVNVSWNAPIIRDLSIDYYTVAYSRVSEQQDGEKSAQFPAAATSGVITDLNSTEDTIIYQFQVFIAVTVDSKTVEGQRSAPVYHISLADSE